MITTKEQERKALGRIRNIVAGLGEDSYIAAAFKGVFEYAEANIEDDAAYSLKDDYDGLGKHYEQAVINAREATKRTEEAEKRAEEAEKRAVAESERADKWVKKYHEMEETSTKNWVDFKYHENRADQLEQEIIKLKARLYDLMTVEK